MNKETQIHDFFAFIRPKNPYQNIQLSIRIALFVTARSRVRTTGFVSLTKSSGQRVPILRHQCLKTAIVTTGPEYPRRTTASKSVASSRNWRGRIPSGTARIGIRCLATTAHISQVSHKFKARELVSPNTSLSLCFSRTWLNGTYRSNAAARTAPRQGAMDRTP